MHHIEVSFTSSSKQLIEILIALLSGADYEGFEETENSLKAFIPISLFNEQQLKEITSQLNLECLIKELPDINWNKEWEANFKPVVIESFCAVRAAFHQPIKNVQHEIIITPKMSFGTGHHATTYMMIKQMQNIEFLNKQVVDFGTGTGVLAILAEQLGAAKVLAIDNDEWSITNALENIRNNNAVNIELQPADHFTTHNPCDIILANITRNVIADNFSLFSKNLIPNGILLLSGLLHEDEAAIMLLASKHKFIFINKLQKDNWMCLKLTKQLSAAC